MLDSSLDLKQVAHKTSLQAYGRIIQRFCHKCDLRRFMKPGSLKGRMLRITGLKCAFCDGQ